VTQLPRPAWPWSLAWLLAPVVVCVGLLASRRFQGESAPGPGGGGGPLATGGADIDEKIAQTARRIRRKDAVLAGVVEGRRTLFQAAAMFRALSQGRPSSFWARFRDRFPGANDDERHCREVLHWLNYPHILADAGERARLIEKLERDLDEAVRRGGVKLPEVSPEELGELRPAGEPPRP
jgi:hypothetical protein